MSLSPLGAQAKASVKSKKSFFGFSFQSKKASLPTSLPPKRKSKTLPGPESQKWAAELKRYECPQITYVGDQYPIFLKSAFACNVTDVDHNRYLDLSSSFGVVGLGHSHPAILRAMNEQARRMFHGMGDVHPNEVKVLLAKKLSEITPGNLSQTIFSSTGAEAVETALKTAVMITKKPGVIAFSGAYHGLCYGTLAATHRTDFKAPFAKQLGAFVQHAPFPDTMVYENKATEISMKAVEAIIKKSKKSKMPIGAILIEPIQGRGGIHVAPIDFLKSLRALCDQEKIVLIADEVFSGFGRAGHLFVIEKSGVVPDLLCLGKGLGNGFPISACIGSMRSMFAWGASVGDAIHTSTYLGHPTGAAIALEVIRQIEEHKLVDRSRQMGESLRKQLWKLKEKYPFILDVRGSGLMIGVEFGELALVKKTKKVVPYSDRAKRFIAQGLEHGLILLSSGPDHNVVSITPPLIISEKEIQITVAIFEKILQKL